MTAETATSDLPYEDTVEAPTKAQLLDKFVDLTARKRQLERELKQVKEELGDQHSGVVAQLLEYFLADHEGGCKHAPSGKTVSISKKLWARPAGDKVKAAEAMKQLPELADFVELGFNTHSVSAHFRELHKQRTEAGDLVVDPNELVPEQLEGLLAISEDLTLGLTS